jgi:hypothetical protein
MVGILQIFAPSLTLQKISHFLIGVRRKVSKAEKHNFKGHSLGFLRDRSERLSINPVCGRLGGPRSIVTDKGSMGKGWMNKLKRTVPSNFVIFLTFGILGI